MLAKHLLFFTKKIHGIPMENQREKPMQISRGDVIQLKESTCNVAGMELNRQTESNG